MHMVISYVIPQSTHTVTFSIQPWNCVGQRNIRKICRLSGYPPRTATVCT